VTLRDIQSFVSYLLFAGRACHAVIRDGGDPAWSLPQLPYKGDGALFRLCAEAFDPAGVSHPAWDERLVKGEIDGREWLTEAVPEVEALDPANIARFRGRKRAFFYYHEAGSQLFSIADDDDEGFRRFMESSDQEAMRHLIRKLNRVFGAPGDAGLRVWQCHRYGQSTRRVLYSALERPRREFEIARPRLSQRMADAFDLVRDHLLLRLRSEPAASLRVDFGLYRALSLAERGAPVMALETSEARRLWQFMEALAGPADPDEEAQLWVLDPLTRETMEVTVDRERRQFIGISPGEPLRGTRH